jgi:tagatose-6-phosphate ketose/aldose isomerase
VTSTRLLDMDRKALQDAGAIWTASEIAQQPSAWTATDALVQAQSAAVDAYLAYVLADPARRIVLTGAGSSSFVGECLAPAMARRLARRVDAVATTDLIAAPRSFLQPDDSVLLVSFARSGNSPESVATLELTQRCVRRCHHLVFTCNPDGELLRRARSMDHAFAVLLPEETHDRSFAMTSSFSSMLLAAARIFGLMSGAGAVAAGAAAQRVIERSPVLACELAAAGYERVVYLGAGELKGLAREAALKLLELTDGGVVAIADTPLGFRHGPKTVVNRRTLVVMFMASDDYSRGYDLDLLRELRSDGVAARVVALSARPLEDEAVRVDLGIPDDRGLDGIGLCFPYLVFAQLLALQNSLALGLSPDRPNAAGVVHRVVQGVTIHPFERST